MPEFSRELYSFVEIARCNSLKEAAERLNIAASALSRQMNLLESDLGVSLLVRNVRGVELTEQGQMVLKYAKRWISEGIDLRSSLAGLNLGSAGQVRVGAMDCFSRTLMPRLYRSALDMGIVDRMDVRISDTETLTTGLMENTLDLIIAFNVQQKHAVRLLSVIPCRVGLVYANDLLDSAPQEISIRDCLNYPICLPGESLSLHPRLFSEILKQRKKPNIIASSSNINFVRELVSQNLCVSFLTFYDVQAEVEAGILGYIPLIEKRLIETLCICVPSKLPLTKVQRTIAKQAQDLLQDTSLGQSGTMRTERNGTKRMI